MFLRSPDLPRVASLHHSIFTDEIGLQPLFSLRKQLLKGERFKLIEADTQGGIDSGPMVLTNGGLTCVVDQRSMWRQPLL